MDGGFWMGLIQPSTTALKAVRMSADDETYSGWQGGWMVAVGLFDGVVRSLQLDSDLQLVQGHSLFTARSRWFCQHFICLVGLQLK